MEHFGRQFWVGAVFCPRNCPETLGLRGSTPAFVAHPQFWAVLGVSLGQFWGQFGPVRRSCVLPRADSTLHRHYFGMPVVDFRLQSFTCSTQVSPDVAADVYKHIWFYKVLGAPPDPPPTPSPRGPRNDPQGPGTRTPSHPDHLPDRQTNAEGPITPKSCSKCQVFGQGFLQVVLTEVASTKGREFERSRER